MGARQRLGQGAQQEARADQPGAQDARETVAFFKRWPMYREITETMERLWNEGAIMGIYR